MREHAIIQVRTKLTQKGFRADTIEQVLDYLLAEKWLCERRFCESFVRSRVAKGQGRDRILSDLRQLNLAEKDIQDALDAESVDWQRLCDKVLAKKIGRKSAPPTMKQAQKLMRFMQYRGFGFELTRDSLRRRCKDE